MALGKLNAESLGFRAAVMSSAERGAGFGNDIAAVTSSPRSGSGMPSTMHSFTPGMLRASASTPGRHSTGDGFYLQG